jgi:hypothetical protein
MPSIYDKNWRWIIFFTNVESMRKSQGPRAAIDLFHQGTGIPSPPRW